MSQVNVQSHIDTGIVVIGRNEAERLPATFKAFHTTTLAPIVYVDSCSTDNSVEVAQNHAIQTLVLSPDKAVNAARARNVGAYYLLEHFPDLRYLQFVDGDTELYPDWLATAITHLDSHTCVGFVCGQLREKDRNSNIYRRLCDMEWRWEASGNAEPSTLGGIGLMRVSAFKQAGGFDETLITGEDPELYGRLVDEGWKLHVLSAPMGLHDSGMVAFKQWWIRAVKSGFSFANSLDPNAWRRERRSALMWCVGLPLAASLGAVAIDARFLALLLAFPLNVCRIRASSAKEEFSSFDCWLYAGACMLMKIPQCIGIAKFYWRKRTGQIGLLIQYK
ncbi:glycosyltransferase family 2 protein [Methylotuvimicrobium sp. KM1]|uniref:glycosyltransferase family 2 protein n=1 Tax=Methylotuvimicrobium sp. KM1 TaxID=3377707 RepID=UPI0038505F86